MSKKSKRPVITGTLSKHKRGFGFVITEDDESDIYIAGRSMGGAMDGDIVAVDLIPEALWGSSREGIIVKVLERKTTEVVGTFQKSKKFGFVVPEGKKGGEDLFVRKADFGKAQNGDKVVAVITKYPDKKNNAEGKITEIISRRDEPGGDIKALLRSEGLNDRFPSRVNAEAKAVSKAGVTEKDIAGRRDLRDKTIITIDGADSKDFDDAVSVDILPNGNYLLGVHIADVTHYVRDESELDQEALKRGNSVYLIDQVVPMLPKRLSNGICSLNPDEDRLTLSVDMEISPNGDVVGHDIYEAVIHSKARMVYTDVSDMLEHGDKELIEQYRDIYDDILKMDELAKILRKKRDGRGSLDFDFDEAYISLDEQGIPHSIDIAERRTANKLIEEFMLLANQTVAERFYWMEVPFVYRIHEAPAPEKMQEFKSFLNGFGLTFKGSAENVHPKTLNKILEDVKGKSYENVINTVMLRAMKKAYYGIDCQGHFGLALKYYCHFTSPIRRYPDLMIHRIIKASLHGQLNEKTMKRFRRKAIYAADQSSQTERHAIALEREVEKMKKAEYMSYHIGEEFDGVISGVTGFGIYVELENTIEGMIRLDSLWDDYYVHIPDKYCVIGERTGKKYMLGQKVRIGVDGVSIDSREIDFVFAE